MFLFSESCCSSPPSNPQVDGVTDAPRQQQQQVARPLLADIGPFLRPVDAAEARLIRVLSNLCGLTYYMSDLNVGAVLLLWMAVNSVIVPTGGCWQAAEEAAPHPQYLATARDPNQLRCAAAGSRRAAAPWPQAGDHLADLRAVPAQRAATTTGHLC